MAYIARLDGFCLRHSPNLLGKAAPLTLANFHAIFLSKQPLDLWTIGTYWHLDTRPEELQCLKDNDLKNAAKLIDQKLPASPFQTIVHGDAK